MPYLRIASWPAPSECWWYSLLLIGILAAMIGLLFRRRVRRLTHASNVRVEERSAKRARIARDLHDKLLQSFQGLLFRMQAVREMLPHQPVEAIPVLDTALLQGEEAVEQARSAVGALRTPHTVERDFVAGLTAIAAEEAQVAIGGRAPSWTVEAKGRVREMTPTVLYDLYHVAQEALGNANRHAHAEHIVVTVRFAHDLVKLDIADDGVGFDEAQTALESRSEHYGLNGMRERMARIGGEVTVRSRPGEGTRVAVSVPAPVAYRTVKGSGLRALLPWRPRPRNGPHD